MCPHLQERRPYCGLQAIKYSKASSCNFNSTCCCTNSCNSTHSYNATWDFTCTCQCTYTCDVTLSCFATCTWNFTCICKCTCNCDIPHSVQLTRICKYKIFSCSSCRRKAEATPFKPWSSKSSIQGKHQFRGNRTQVSKRRSRPNPRGWGMSTITYIGRK